MVLDSSASFSGFIQLTFPLQVWLVTFRKLLEFVLIRYLLNFKQAVTLVQSWCFSSHPRPYIHTPFLLGCNMGNVHIAATLLINVMFSMLPSAMSRMRLKIQYIISFLPLRVTQWKTNTESKVPWDHGSCFLCHHCRWKIDLPQLRPFLCVWTLLELIWIISDNSTNEYYKSIVMHRFFKVEMLQNINLDGKLKVSNFNNGVTQRTFRLLGVPQSHQRVHVRFAIVLNWFNFAKPIKP